MGVLRVCLFGFLLLSGCTSTTHTLLTRMPALKERNPKKVQVFLNDPPRKSRAIAVVSVARDGENATWAVEILKDEAAELGADAITHVELNYSSGLFPNLRAQAVAVQYE